MNTDSKSVLRRLAVCLAGALVLALMVGPQSGTQTDFGIAFRDALLHPRVLVFLGIGLAVFLAITFWPTVRPYLRRPGVVPLVAGALGVVVAQAVMNWYDPIADNSGSSKFGALTHTVSITQSGRLESLTVWFFVDHLAWYLFGAAVLLGGATIITRLRLLGYATAVVGVAGAVITFVVHQNVIDVGAHIDHSLGAYVDVAAFALLGAAGIVAVHARTDTADPRAFLTRASEWRPGLPFALLGIFFGICAYVAACWFGPTTRNADFAATGKLFTNEPVSSLATSYLNWAGWVLFLLAAFTAVAATYLRIRILGWLALAVSVIGVVCTFLTLHSMTGVGSSKSPNDGVTWKNLGVGGYLACVVFSLLAAAGAQVLSAPRSGATAEKGEDRDRQLPITRMLSGAKTARGRAVLIAVAGIALFYPPMLATSWQSTLVGNIGVYVLLALGLNVVIGWAGLLDLGYIAFYEVGAYTTAYFVGALPKKPPAWLHLTPLVTIPFAIVACLIAGVLLGAPTLRLRGDYLAIVTLGFGEIIQLMGVNNFGGLTGGTVQAPNIPHPRLNLFGIHVTWGQDSLPYWYLLLVLIVIVIVLFYKLEGSRLGRAWAAVREDEVAAQASGVNTVRVKLLAFAIGASTSGFAGAFYGSYVGYFDPTQFTLQLSILIVAYVVFGGMGSIIGVMLGAATLTWLPQFLKSQVPQQDRIMWLGALLVVMMIFRPAGLLPAKRRKAELSGLDDADSAEVSAVPRGGAM